MKNQKAKGLSLLLTLALLVSMCFGMSVTSFAANDVSLTAAFSETNLTQSNEEQTVHLRIAPSFSVTICSFEFTVSIPNGWTLTEIKPIENSGVTSITAGDYNLTNGHIAWTTDDTEDTQISAFAEYVFTVPANVSGTFTVNVSNGSLGKNYGLDTVAMENDSTSATLTIAPAPVAVSSITLNKDKLGLLVGASETLTAKVLPDNATVKDVTWESDKEDVATVVNGVVTAKAPGKAIITVRSASDKAVTATCEVTVTAVPVPVTGITLADAEVSVGRTLQLTPKFTPAGTTQTGLTWESSDETKATVDENGLVKGIAEGEVTITATSKENPSIKASCKVTVTKKDSTIVIPGDDSGAGVIAGGAIIGALGNGSLPFNDVTARDYFYDAVKWAVDQGITSGTSRYTFSPDAPCTRAQVVTFLWRAAGCPQPSSKTNPFTDVHADDYFYTAVLWAVENGITNGTSAKTFSPDATVTRAQVVTFLWRANGQPAAGNSGFLDVSSNAYYARAVDWAFANGITTGVDYGAFGPDTACTRAQIVTFLYRAR